MQEPDQVAPLPGGHGAPRFHLNPRTVPEHLHNFKVAVEDYFNKEDPGRRESYYCVGITISPRAKHTLKLFITQRPGRKVIIIEYRMPVAPEFADIFGSPVARTLPSRGPHMVAHDLVGRESERDFIFRTVGPTAPPENRMVFWKSEMVKAQRVRDTLPDPDASEDTRDRQESRSHAAGRMLEYWTDMYEPIMRALAEAGIHMPREDNQFSSPWRSPAASPVAVEVPALPGRSSTATRRRRSSVRRRRATRRKSTSDPTRRTPPNIFNIVPAIGRRSARRNDNIFTPRNISHTEPEVGKRVRRRRANSDPKDD